MPKFIIERELPGAHRLSEAELAALSRKSCDVLRDLGPEIHWIQSYVATDKIYCLYRAPSEQLIRQHAERGGFPITRITPVTTTIDPSTAEAAI